MAGHLFNRRLAVTSWTRFLRAATGTSLLLCWFLLACTAARRGAAAADPAATGTSRTFHLATFVPPASPHAAADVAVTTRGSRKTPLSKQQQPTWVPPMALPEELHPRATTTTTTTALFSKKKPAAPAATKKIQVKLTKHVAGTGQAGQVVMVTPAFFNNKLRPTHSAVIITDDEVAKEQAEAKQHEQETNQMANEIKGQLEATALTIVRKAGPEGHLFGGVGPKAVMDELNELFPTRREFLSQKGVKVTSMTKGEEGKKLRGDIKETGEYGATIALTKGISAKVAIQVKAED